jgi:hypothetical protein
VSSLKRFVLVTAICAFLASAALYAEFNAGFYTLQGPGSIRQTMPFAATASASYDVAAYTLYPAMLAAGDGEQEVASYCKYVSQHPVYHYAASAAG